MEFLTAGGDVTTNGRDIQSVDLVFMPGEGVLNQEVAVPDLKLAVPANSGEVRELLGGGVPDLADPVGVVVLVAGPLALTTDVPQLDGLLSADREDDTVLGGERAGENFFLVPDELMGELTLLNIPEPQGLIP